MFVIVDDIIVNEIVLCFYNLGYYFIEVCDFLQFDIYILGVLGVLFLLIKFYVLVVMFNVLG